MCFYITATLPKGTQIEEITEILESHQMKFSEIDNRIVKSQLRSGELYFRLTKAYCDCDTILGSLNSLQEYQTLAKSKKVKTLKKKKWTDEQINDWIKEKLKNCEKDLNKKYTSTEINLRLSRWTKFLNDLLDKKKVSRIGLLKHWYVGGLEEEEIKIMKTEKIGIKQVNSDLLLNLSEDILYEFLPSYDFN
ncbi:MAG: hypothetical protein ACFFE4_01890 [Candidatus Thorarchaeota archaeon]